jgi:hypothetical protein
MRLTSSFSWTLYSYYYYCTTSRCYRRSRRTVTWATPSATDFRKFHASYFAVDSRLRQRLSRVDQLQTIWRYQKLLFLGVYAHHLRPFQAKQLKSHGTDEKSTRQLLWSNVSSRPVRRGEIPPKTSEFPPIIPALIIPPPAPSPSPPLISPQSLECR